MSYDRNNVASMMPPSYFRDDQNTVVIGLAPNRVNSGDTPSWYRFMANLTSTNAIRRNTDQGDPRHRPARLPAVAD